MRTARVLTMNKDQRSFFGKGGAVKSQYPPMKMKENGMGGMSKVRGNNAKQVCIKQKKVC